jgi:hypothetical protein
VEIEGLLVCLQNLATGPCLEQDSASSHPTTNSVSPPSILILFAYVRESTLCRLLKLHVPNLMVISIFLLHSEETVHVGGSM